MEKKVKITLSLPDGVLTALEEARAVRGMSRNEFLRMVVAGYLLRQTAPGEALIRYLGGRRPAPEDADN